MKKIFTLICMAFVAMSINAQEPDASYAAATADGISSEFTNATASGTDLIANISGSFITVKAVSSKTPIEIDEAGKDNTNWPADGWDNAAWKAGGNNNQSKSAIDFWTVYGTGVPYISFTGKQKYTDGEPQGKYHPNFNDGVDGADNGWVYYATDGSLGLPASGEYVEVTSNAKGMLKVGFWANKGGGRSLYIADKESKQALALDKFKVEGFVNGVEVPTDEPYIDPETGQQGIDNQDNLMWVKRMKFFPSIPVNDDYTIGVADYLLEETGETKNLLNQHKYGWFVFDVEPNKTYVIFGGNWQFGFQGYKFYKDATIDNYVAVDPRDDATGISTIKTENANAVRYNMAGQKVSQSYKGVVIENGKKMLVK